MMSQNRQADRDRAAIGGLHDKLDELIGRMPRRGGLGNDAARP